MLSLTAEYALRALIFLAQHAEDWPIPGNVIAERIGVPPKYLSTILSELVRAGVLESSRGKSGGFRMTVSPEQTTLREVIAPFEQLERRRCPFGNQACSDDAPCLAHEKWKRVNTSFQEFLLETSVRDVAVKKEAPSRARRGAKRS